MYTQYYVQVFHAPFSVCVDHRMKSVILTVRGTLSIKVRNKSVVGRSFLIHSTCTGPN